MDELARAEALFEGLLPQNTKLTIERQSGKLPLRYIFRCQYTSKNSGRTMCVVAKGETLPVERNNLFWFYQRQLTLTPNEIAREFSRLYFLERRARQEAFLRGELGNIRVSGKSVYDTKLDHSSTEDKLGYAEYI